MDEFISVGTRVSDDEKKKHLAWLEDEMNERRKREI